MPTLALDNVLVVVVWVDANYQRGEITLDDMRPLMRLRSAGWLVADTKEYVTLAMDRCDVDGTFRDVTHIPKAGIVKIHKVKVPKTLR